eukprot:TCALIF_07562-PA protein Name:"Protein of unknown function" AED:0.00 eAED:0.00 QI:185/1/1/1/1/1/2/0/68
MAAFSKRLMNTMNTYFDKDPGKPHGTMSEPPASQTSTHKTSEQLTGRQILKVQGPILADVSKVRCYVW